MNEADKHGTADGKLAALFAAADVPPEQDAAFVETVMNRIRRRERIRWLILGAGALIAAIIAIPAFSELGNAFGGIDLSALGEYREWFYQSPHVAADFLRSATRSIIFWAAATLAITIVPLVRWLAD